MYVPYQPSVRPRWSRYVELISCDIDETRADCLHQRLTSEGSVSPTSGMSGLPFEESQVRQETAVLCALSSKQSTVRISR